MPLPVPRALRMLAVAVVLATALTGLRATNPVDAKPIEGYPDYQPQTSCSPRPKPGTVMLSEHLLRKYKGTGSLGISRACSGSGVSEHKEGRAFDWALDARSGRDRGYARDFLSRIRSTDRWGNRNALARRMGIMYVIWNDHIWSASTGYRKRDYLHGSCKKLENCSATLRHRDHMHISLSRAAARAETSWYVKRSTPKPAPEPAATPKPAPEPDTSRDEKPDSGTTKRRPKLPDGILDLRSKPYRAIRVPVDGGTVETRFKLREGVTYSLTAAGLYGYGDPHKVGDAVCTWSKGDQAWVPQPSRRAKRRFGRLALSVNGELPFGEACRGSHTYRTHITPTKDQPLRLRLLSRGESSKGRLTVVVGRKRARVGSALPTYPSLAPAPTATERRKGYGLIAETVSVPAADADGTYTVGSVRPGVTYRVTVSGAVRLGGGVRSNGQCLSIGGSWYRHASVDRRVPGQDHGDLYVNGAPFAGRGSSGCASSTRTTDFTPESPGRMRLDLWDPLARDDNSGELRVKVQRLTPIPTPTAPSAERPRLRRTEWQQPRDRFEVNPRSKTGTLSTIRLRKGVQAQIFVRGRYTSTGVSADASCVRTAAGWTPTVPDVVEQDPLNVWVDDQPVRWRALGPGDGCSSEYRYTTRFTPARNGPIRVSVFDLDHRDNKGLLEVRVLREPR